MTRACATAVPRGRRRRLSPLNRLALVLALLAGGAVRLPAGQRGPVAPPSLVGAIPSARQLAWHDLQFYGFLHFSVNTFTDKDLIMSPDPGSPGSPGSRVSG